MTLPFDKLNPTDKVIIDSLKAQNDSLREQTKILHTISDEIFKQKRSSSDKSTREMQREIFKLGSGISEIKSYLAGKGKGSGSSAFNNKAQPDKGFFTNLFSKVFGPSRYQQKMMDDMSALRDVTERQARSIEFIARQNSDSKRAQEREKLAEAIARRMSYLDMGGGGPSRGMLGTLGKVLIAGIVGSISLLSKTLMTAFNALFEGLKKLIEAFAKFRLPVFPPLGGAGGAPDMPDRRPGGSGPVPMPGEKPGGRTPVPGKPGGRPGRPIPPSNQLPPPESKAPYKPGYKSRFPWNTEKYGPQTETVNPRTSGGPRFAPSGSRAALISALVALGLTGMANELMQSEGDDTDEIVRRVREKLPGKGYMPGSPSANVTNRNLAPGESLDILNQMGGSRLLLDDPGVPGRKITAEQYKRLYGKDLTEGQTKNLDEFILKEKQEEAEREKLRLEYDEMKNQSEFNKLLKDATEALEGFADNLDFLSKERLAQTIVPFLDQLGEISIQGQKINLAPGLGTALAKTMEDTMEMSEELADYMKEKFTAPTIITNNNVIDNSNRGGGGGTTFVPPKPTHQGSRTLDEYFFGRNIK